MIFLFLTTVLALSSEIEDTDQSIFQRVLSIDKLPLVSLYHAHSSHNTNHQAQPQPQVTKPLKLFPVSMGSWQNYKILDGASIFDTQSVAPLTSFDLDCGLQFDPDFENTKKFNSLDFDDFLSEMKSQFSPDAGRAFIFLKRSTLLQAIGVKQKIVTMQGLAEMPGNVTYDDVVQFSILLMDGPYSNQFDIIHFEELVVIKDLVFLEQINQTYPRQKATIYKYKNWILQEEVQDMYLDLKMTGNNFIRKSKNYFDKRAQKLQLQIGFKGTFLQVQAETITQEDHAKFDQKFSDFSFYTCVLQGVLIYLVSYSGDSEFHRFWNSCAQRLGEREIRVLQRNNFRVIQEEPPFYIQKLSLVSSYMILVAYVLHFFIQTEFTRLGQSEYVLLVFVFQYAIVILHLRFLLITLRMQIMDWYSIQGNQGITVDQLEAKQIKCMFLSVVTILVLMVFCVAISQKFSFLDDFFVLVVFGSIWVPQVIVNFRYGWGNVPTFKYAIVVMANVLYMPLYFKWNPDNFMSLKPKSSDDPFWPMVILLVFLFQIGSLWSQSFFPGVLRGGCVSLFRVCLRQEADGFYQYETKFTEELSHFNTPDSSCSSNDSFQRVNKTMIQSIFQTKSQEKKQIKKLKKLRHSECIICFEKLCTEKFENDQIAVKVDTFFKTPCKHRFHRNCLLQWIRTVKNECPICRAYLPYPF